MKRTRIITLFLAALLAASALAACRQHPPTDWREDVNSALSKDTAKSDRPNIQTSTAVTTTVEPSETTIPVFVEFPPKTVTVVKEPESYTNINAGKIHPISNPDETPEICIGNTSHLLYQSKIYHSYRSGATANKELVSVDLSEMVSYDPTAEQYSKPVPESVSVCTDPFCSHGSGDCPATFPAGITLFAIFAIDYEGSAGGPPVFYVVADEPGYIQVGEQQITQKAEDAAIYRYDSQTGKREVLVQDLPKRIYGFAVGGGYIYYTSRTGLVALDRSGKEVARIGEEDNCHYIITMENGRLYYCDSVGKLYSAKPDLSDVRLEYQHDLTNMSETVASMISTIGDVPFGYRVADGYAYYCSDFVSETIDREEYSDIELKSSSIYRLDLNDPSAEPELLVKDGCKDTDLLGVADEKVYYRPNTYYEDGNPAETVCAVDLSTLKNETVAENAYKIPSSGALCTDDVILTSEFILGKNMHDPYFYLLYHFETGDLMYISNEFDCGEVVTGE